MSLIQNIDGELAAMTTGIGRVLELTAETGNAVGQIASGAAGSGFTGIAQRMAHVGDAIRQLHGQLVEVGRSINETRGPVGKAPDQASPQDTIKALDPAGHQISAIHGAIGAAVSKVNEIHTQTAGALQGGQQEPMLRRLDAIRQVLTTVARTGNAAKQHVETALAEARQVGETGN